MNLSRSRTKSVWIVLAAALATLLPADELTAAPVHRSQRTLRDSEMLGVPWNADGLSNVQIGGQQNRRVGIRFRADRDGTLDRIKLFFIFSTWEDFAAEGSTKCQDDHLGCYGAGDGGDLLIQVRADDGSHRHAPSGRVLSSRLIPDPMNRNREPPVYAVGSGLGGRAVWNFWVIDMPDVRLRAGRLYHIVLSNPSPDPVQNFVSLDHLYLAANAPHMQPAVSDMNLASEVLQRNDSRWRIRHWETPIFEIRYTGGFVQGQGYSGTSVAFPASNLRSIHGSGNGLFSGTRSHVRQGVPSAESDRKPGTLGGSPRNGERGSDRARGDLKQFHRPRGHLGAVCLPPAEEDPSWAGIQFGPLCERRRVQPIWDLHPPRRRLGRLRGSEPLPAGTGAGQRGERLATRLLWLRC